MKENPLVSVVTPAYQAAVFLPEALASVQRQTFADWEMIVVDDASRDDTSTIAASAAASDSRVRVERFQQNRGSAAARNRALELARGRFVAFLDADDLWLPHKLETQLEYLQRSGAAFCFSSFRILDAKGHPTRRVVIAPPRMTYAELLRNTVIGCLTVVIDREATGAFAFPDLRAGQDFALWLTLLKRGHVAHGLPDILAGYRRHSGGLSGNAFRAARRTWRVYRDHEGLGRVEAARCFASYAARALVKYAP